MDIPCSLTEGHFGCYQFGTLINKDVRPFCTGFCVDISFHASGINARVGGSGRPLLGTVPGPDLRGVSSP